MKNQWKKWKRIKRVKDAMAHTFLILTVCIWTCRMQVSAAEGKITTSITNLTSLVFTVLGGIGTIYLALGIFDFSSAISGHDPSQQKQGLTRIVSGLMMISVKLITDFIK